MAAVDIENIRRAVAEGEREQAFWHAHHQELLERYPNQFVSARHGEIVAASNDLRELIRMLESLGVAPNETWLKFMATPDRLYIL